MYTFKCFVFDGGVQIWKLKTFQELLFKLSHPMGERHGILFLKESEFENGDAFHQMERGALYTTLPVTLLLCYKLKSEAALCLTAGIIYVKIKRNQI